MTPLKIFYDPPLAPKSLHTYDLNVVLKVNLVTFATKLVIVKNRLTLLPRWPYLVSRQRQRKFNFGGPRPSALLLLFFVVVLY